MNIRIGLFLILPFLLFQLLFSATEIDMTFDVGVSPYNCDYPQAMCYDETNDVLWLIDSYNIFTEIRIFQLDPSTGEINAGWPQANPYVQTATGIAYDSSNDDLIILIGGVTYSNKLIRVDIDNPNSATDITQNIPFDYPVDLYWNDSGETRLWTSKNDPAYPRAVYNFEPDSTPNWSSPFLVESKYPAGVMCDDTYFYSQGHNNGVIYRYDKVSGERDDLNGLFPMDSPFEVGTGSYYTSNMWFDSDHDYESGYFWMLSWSNKKIYRVEYWQEAPVIQTTSLGNIKALFE